MMTIVELRRVLDDVAHLCLSAGAKATAKNLTILTNALSAHAQMEVAAFCTEVRNRLSEASAKPKGGRKAPVAPTVTVLNNNAVQRHVFALRGTGTSRASFDAAFEALKADRSLKAADVAEVARLYANSVTRYKSIKSAHADISKAFVRQARFENKLR
jgi:hypothetical protein